MKQVINISICLSDIPKDKIFTAQNGKKYVSLTVVEKKEIDQWGKTHFVALSKNKDSKEEKIVYVGSGKFVVPNTEPKQTEVVTPQDIDEMPSADDIDDLPF